MNRFPSTSCTTLSTEWLQINLWSILAMSIITFSPTVASRGIVTPMAISPASRDEAHQHEVPLPAEHPQRRETPAWYGASTLPWRWPGSLCYCPLPAVRSTPLERTWVRSTPSERTRRPGLREDQKVPLPWNRPVFPESGNGGPFHPRRTDRCSRTPGKSVRKMHVPRVWNTAGSVPSP